MQSAGKVSLVVPVRNESSTLSALWDSIRRQTLAPDEVVIVDGGSDDGTAQLARRLTADDPRVQVIEAGMATPGRGRNIGIAAARNDWVALTDAGIQLDPGWLKALVDVTAHDPEIQVVYGHYEPIVTTFFHRCAALAYVAVPSDTPAGRMRGPSIASALLRRSAWAAAGGFPDLRAGEDRIFMARLEELAIPTGWAPTAVIRWELRHSLGATFRKFFVYSSQAVVSGRHHDWHRSVLRKYLMAFPFVLAAIRGRDWRWAAFPAIGAAGRVGRSIWRRREGRGMAWAANPVQFAGVAFVIATIDVATFLGWGHALSLRLRQRQQTAMGDPLGDASLSTAARMSAPTYGLAMPPHLEAASGPGAR